MEWLRRGEGIEKVSLRNTDIALMASAEGIEVLHYRLPAGRPIQLRPEEGWDALELLVVLSGALRWHDRDVVLGPGDAVCGHPVNEHTVLTTAEETEFLYVTSRPVFHQYSATVRTMMDLAQEIEVKDGYTADHCDRIKQLAMAVGQHMGLSPRELFNLNIAAFLHDIGKVKVPESILGKPGPLDSAEWEVMRQHPTFGRQMLEATRLPVLQAAAPIVEQHHERWDGKGYPHGLQGQQILLPASIIAVVDAYDAMTTDRPYRRGLPPEQALGELGRGRGTQFRPDVVDAFLSIADQVVQRGGPSSCAGSAP